MSALTDPDNFVQTGFSTSNSYDDAESGEILVDELAMNEHKNLMMSRQRIFSPTEGLRTTYNGVLYRTFTELDLFEMERINDCIRRKAEIGQIDKEFMLAIYEGHTMFSIYFDQIRVYDAAVESVENYVAEEESLELEEES